MQHRAGEVAGEKEVAAAAHYEDGLWQRGPVNGQKVLFLSYFHIQGTAHHHTEGVPGGKVELCLCGNHRLERKDITGMYASSVLFDVGILF